MSQHAFAFAPPRPAPEPTEQERELARVSGRIAETVLEFARRRLQGDRHFRASELSAYVMSLCGGAPASADRVFRALRASGQIRATLLSRTGSLYRIDGVA